MDNSYNFEEIKEQILKLIKELGRIPKDKEIIKNHIICDIRPIKRYFKCIGYDNWTDYFRELGYKKDKDIKVGQKYKSPHHITLEDIKIICTDFYNRYGKYPTSVDFNTSYNELPSYTSLINILKCHDLTWFDFIKDIGVERFYPDINKYEEYLNKFKEISNKLGRALKYSELLNNEYNLPCGNWFVQHCPDRNITNYNQFVEFTGFLPRYQISKELAIKLILELRDKLNRPLLQDDFIYLSDSEKTIGISTIKNYWGSVNNMKNELGLEIVQESMIYKHKSKEEMIEDMKLFINQLGRLPNTYEVNSNKNMANACTYRKFFGGINNVFLLLGYKPNKKDISQHLTNNEIIKIYKDFVEDFESTPTYEYCKKIYNLPSPRTVVRRLNCSWNEFMLMLGCKPNSKIARGDICYAKDGTMCFSFAESIVHNYLIDKNITIISKEYFYRDLIEDNIELQNLIGYKRCDWLLKSNNQLYIVEYFGFIGNEEYNQRHNLKLDFIKKANLQDKFIAIYPKDLNKLDNVFILLK